MPKILITGGTGRLAAELKKHLLGAYVGIEHFDFTYVDEIPDENYDLVLHMGAYTNVKKAEEEKIKCFNTNVLGTFNLVQKYKNTPFIYISTEYANNPLGVYALTKKLGEEIVATHPNHVILRTSFKPTPFPFPYAYEDQYTQGDYVDVIAKLLADYVSGLDLSVSLPCKINYLGTGRKTLFELAKKTRPDVLPNKVQDYIKEIELNIIPKDYQDVVLA